MVQTASEKLPERSRGVSGGLLGGWQGHLWPLPRLPGALRQSQEVLREAPGTPLGGSGALRGRLLFSGEVFWGVSKLLKNSWLYCRFAIGLGGPFAILKG